MATSLVTPTLPQPQLHSPLEFQKIIACASAVPRNGVLLETGTGPGGTTNLLREHSDPSVRISTLDVNQAFSQARLALGDRNVTFIDGTSDVAASDWNDPIDFLFIDSGHRLYDVNLDITAWFRHLAPGARVAFHDYDTQVGGGIHQSGVRVAVDTLIRLGVLTDIEQHTTLLTATVPDPHVSVTAHDYAETLRLTGRKAIEILEFYTPSLLEWLLDPGAVKASAIISAGPTLDVNHRHHEAHPALPRLNQLMFCYLFDHWMKHHQAKAFSLTNVEGVTRYQEMMLWIDAERWKDYPHICSRDVTVGTGAYPQSLNYYRMSTVEEVSRFVTLEQTRVLMLSYVTNPIFDRILPRLLGRGPSLRLASQRFTAVEACVT